ncbi:MAG: FIST C-terminal domain-containing protein [Magnetospirillum sp.]|nr:FIST C-terminal domain-containing protein [Magnetospirillum sp.]
MITADKANRTRPGGFAVAHASAEHWGIAAKTCLQGVADTAGRANIGFLYATEGLAGDLPSVLTFLRETTRIGHWVGAVAPGICTGDCEYRTGNALAVMVGHLPSASFHCFTGTDGEEGGMALIHADPGNPLVAAMIATAAEATPSLIGGLVSPSDAPSQIADVVTGGGVSGLRLGPAVTVVIGLTQGCTPIGPIHVVTQTRQGVLVELDGRPALDVLKAEAGELIARDLDRAAGYIHLALPAANEHDYQVRSLIGLDRRLGWLAVADHIEAGRRIMFVRRDANGAQADLRRMLAGIRESLGGRPPLAALYTSCVARGMHMFGAPGAETAAIRDALDGVPLIGFFANGEIAGGRLHSYCGVLAVIAGEGG